jgi:uncharacterized protein DUF6385
MPGMPIFQDTPSQLKGQIYVLNNTTSAVEPLKVDNTGNLNVAGTVGLDAGTTVGLAAGTADIGNVGIQTGQTVGLAAGTADIGNVGIQAGQTVGLAAGTADIGNVGIQAGQTVGLDAGTTVGLAAGTADIGNVGIQAGQTVGLAAGTADIGNVGIQAGQTVGLAAGTNAIGTVGLDAGTNVIGKVQNDLVFTNVDSFGAGTILTSKDVGIGATVEADSQDISVESSYNWFIKNTGTVSSDQDITLKVELSPDDGTNWIEDTGTAISVPFNTSKMITVNNFLKNARFVITGGAAATTVISCFQAQH